jgi:hypothetical protein
MELLTRNNFEGWMQKLMERLDRQDELLLAMKAEGKQPTITESIRLFDNQDLCMLLQISKRTLQRYRSVGALPYKTLGKKTYYSVWLWNRVSIVPSSFLTVLSSNSRSISERR